MQNFELGVCLWIKEKNQLFLSTDFGTIQSSFTIGFPSP